MKTKLILIISFLFIAALQINAQQLERMKWIDIRLNINARIWHSYKIDSAYINIRTLDSTRIVTTFEYDSTVQDDVWVSRKISYWGLPRRENGTYKIWAADSAGSLIPIRGYMTK